MLHLVSGISSLFLFVNLILAPVLPFPSPITSSSSDSPLGTSITPSLFHSWLKTYFFHKSLPRSFTSSSRTASADLCLDRFFLNYSVFDFIFSYFLFLGRASSVIMTVLEHRLSLVESGHVIC